MYRRFQKNAMNWGFIIEGEGDFVVTFVVNNNPIYVFKYRFLVLDRPLDTQYQIDTGSQPSVAIFKLLRFLWN